MNPRDESRAAALAALGLPADATREQLTAAYRRAVLATHPDRCADADAAERFAAVLAAYHQALREVGPEVSDQEEPRLRGQAEPHRRRQSAPGAPLVAGPVHYTPYRQPSQDGRG